MNKHPVAIIRYKDRDQSVQKAITLSGAFQNIPKNAKVVIKPNIVYWHRDRFPMWGVITTSRVMEAVVISLKEHGVEDITIVEGILSNDPQDTTLAQHAFEELGYNKLKERYGVKALESFSRPFEKVEFGDGQHLKINKDLLNCDFVVNVPVLKTHAQALVSLGAKNLKGCLDISSRKKCHGADPQKDLDYFIASLSQLMPPSAIIIDGIYSLDQGPFFNGRCRRTNVIIAAADYLSADMVGTKVMGHEPASVPYLAQLAQSQRRPLDMSDLEIRGEPIAEVSSFHPFDFPHEENDTLPAKFHKMGMKGLSYYKYDNSMCTYCSTFHGTLMTAIGASWKGGPFDDVEVLTGKRMMPVPGKKKTILVGQCLYNLHRDNPDIQEMIPIKGCPPDLKSATEALEKIGLEVDPAILEIGDFGAKYFLKKYQDDPEFDLSFYQL